VSSLQRQHYIPTAPAVRRFFAGVKFPPDWLAPHLDDCISADAPVCYGILMPGAHVPNGVPVIKVRDFAGVALRPESLLRTSQEIDKQYHRSRVQPGDILLSIRGSTGEVGIVPADLEGANITQDTARLRVNGEVVPEFIFHAIQGSYVQRQIQLETVGQAVKGINIGSVRVLVVPLPPYPEQAVIAGILKTCDRVTDTLENLLAIKRTRKLGLAQQLLTGKKRFKEFKGKKWRTVRLGELLQEADRYVEFDDEHSYKLASIRRRSEGLFFREELRGHEIKTKVMKTLHTGDFVLSKMQVVHGAWGLVTAEFDGMFVSDSYIALVPRDIQQFKIEFFKYLSQTRYLRHLAYLACHGVHIEKMTFNLDDFLHEKITIPPTIEEQTKIVCVIAACDHEIELLQKLLGALKDQKRGLMQKLLTGQIRVKVPKGERA
jgi:type I restriction enzyme, S subunit